MSEPISLREHPYYGGSLTLSCPEDEWGFELTWEAYEGGEVTLSFDRGEAMALRNALDQLIGPRKPND